MTRFAMIAATVAATAMIAGCGGGGGSDNGHAGGQPEPTPSEPPTISLGSTITGTIDSATDVDSFKLPIAQEGTLTIATSGNANPKIRVLDASGTEIPGRAGSWLVDITEQVLAKGKHVTVEFFGGNVGGSYQGNFMLDPLAVPNPDASSVSKHRPSTNVRAVIQASNYSVRPDRLADKRNWPGYDGIYLYTSPLADHSLQQEVTGLLQAFNVVRFDPVSVGTSGEPLNLYVGNADTDIDIGQEAIERHMMTWGKWAVASVYSLHNEQVSLARPLSMGERTPPNVGITQAPLKQSASYNGRAVVWDSANPDNLSDSGMGLNYTFSDQPHLDVHINYLGVNGGLRYDGVRVGGSHTFTQIKNNGEIQGSFYGPDAEEVGGVFTRYWGPSQAVTGHSFDPEVTVDRFISGSFVARETEIGSQTRESDLHTHR